MTLQELRDIDSRQTVAAMYQPTLPPLVQRIVEEDVTSLLVEVRALRERLEQRRL